MRRGGTWAGALPPSPVSFLNSSLGGTLLQPPRRGEMESVFGFSSSTAAGKFLACLCVLVFMEHEVPRNRMVSVSKTEQLSPESCLQPRVKEHSEAGLTGELLVAWPCFLREGLRVLIQRDSVLMLPLCLKSGPSIENSSLQILPQLISTPGREVRTFVQSSRGTRERHGPNEDQCRHRNSSEG